MEDKQGKRPSNSQHTPRILTNAPFGVAQSNPRYVLDQQHPYSQDQLKMEVIQLQKMVIELHEMDSGDTRHSSNQEFTPVHLLVNGKQSCFQASKTSNARW